jgi:hypothetical protein
MKEKGGRRGEIRDLSDRKLIKEETFQIHQFPIYQ